MEREKKKSEFFSSRLIKTRFPSGGAIPLKAIYPETKEVINPRSDNV